MFGISTSIFNEVGGLVKNWLKNPLNASFFYWYFLPAAGFVLLQMFVIGPMLGYPWPKMFNVEVGPAKSAIDLIVELLSESFFALILLPLAIAFVLSSIAGATLRLYTGTLQIERALLRPWLKRNQKRRIGPLQTLRRQYLFASRGLRSVTVDGEERLEPVAEPDRSALIAQLKQEIQTLHEKFESQN